MFSPEELRSITSCHPSSSELAVASSGSDLKPSPVEKLPSKVVGASSNNDVQDLSEISRRSPLMFDFAGIRRSSIKSFNTDSDVASGRDTLVSINEGQGHRRPSPLPILDMAGNRLVSIKQFNSDIDVSSDRDAAVTNFDDNGTKVDEKKGREKGAIAYGVEEHLALLRVVSATSKSFNSSETSPEWRAAYKAMCNSYYVHWGTQPRLSTTLHAHLVDMYSAIKKGIRILSCNPASPKCPVSYLEADDADLQVYVAALFELIISDKNKFMPKKWWNLEVVSMLLMLHLQYTSQFGNGNQSLDWLESKALQTKSKFEKDQKNREAELALKRKKEEEEQEEANKNRKMVAESSALLTTTLSNMMTAIVAGRSNNDNIDGKLSDFKKDLLKELDAREKQAEQKIADKLDEKFADLVRFLRGG